MSTLKVDGIRSNSATSDAITLASDGTCIANITNRSNRNLIINGAMQVAQRGTSSTSNGYQTVDRFNMNASGTDEAPTQSQVDVNSGDAGDNPFAKGLTKAYRITNGNQTSGAGAADRIRFYQIIEAQNMRHSGWNYTSASSYVTLSFYVKSSVSQNFFFRLTSSDGTGQSYVMETGTLSANTWTKITKTIPGNSNLQFDNDTGQGLYIVLAPFRGTDNTGTRPLNAWATFDGATIYPDMASTWYTTNDATLEFTGFQLEVGSTATDFEHRSFAQELLLCQRYYQEIGRSTTMVGNTGSSQIGNIGVPIACAMRATPTIASGITYHMWHGNNDGKNNDGTAMTINSFSTSTYPQHSPMMSGTVTGFSGNTDNRVGCVVANSGTPIKLNAEL